MLILPLVQLSMFALTAEHKSLILNMLDTLYPVLESSSYAFLIQSAQKGCVQSLWVVLKCFIGYFLTDHFVHNAFIPGSIVLLVSETLFSHPQAYRIVVNKDQITVIGASPVGTWYGLQTLIQLMRLFPPKEGIPPLTVNMWKLNEIHVKYIADS